MALEPTKSDTDRAIQLAERMPSIRRRVAERRLAREAEQAMTLNEGTEQRFTVDAFMSHLDSLADETK